MKYAITETDNGSRLVDQHGSLIKTADADRQMLHVLPKLYVDSAILLQSMRPEHVSLAVTTDQPEFLDLQPPCGSIQISQCVPNKGYFIGGCLDTRYGWFSTIPKNMDAVDLVFHWDIVIPSLGLHRHIEHEIHLNFLPGEYRTWSMDIRAWGRVRKFEPGKPPLAMQPTTPLSPANLSPDRDVEVMDFETCEEDNVLVYIESLDIPSIPYSELAYIEEFQERQIHEIQRQAVFTRNNEAHRENAIVEMPKDIFIAAVRSAIENPPSYPTISTKPTVEHPAIQQLASWWNQHAPNHHNAAYCMPWVRVEENTEEYWCGYYETPNEPFAIFAQNKTANARVGDVLILEFMQQVAVDPSHPHYIDVLLVNGRSSHTVGVSMEEVETGEYDEAWYGLEALCRFPSRFPEVWSALTKDCQLRRPEVLTRC